MPLKYSTRKRSNTRPKAYAALLVALLSLSAAALFGVGASAQRKNDNTSKQQQQSRSSRRVIVGRGSDNASGSRTTITADDSLNDYSAYRSGDRFYVVLPKSAAGAVSKGSGKGYTDVQVQQRGDSVVVSYKVQPGAKPRVEQKFNRLDVVFDVKEGGQPAASGQQSAAATQQPAGENRNASAQQQQQQQQQQATQPKQSATPETSNERRPAEVASNTGQPGAGNPSNNAAQPVEAAQQPGVAQTQAAPSPAVEQAAQAAATAEPQIAQNQPPAPIAPITNPNPSAAGAQAGASFGTMLAQNWPIPLFIALFVVGLGLVFFTRRSSAHAPAELEAAAVATTTKTTLEEPRAARLKEATVETAMPDVATPGAATVDADSIAAKSAPLAEVAPLIAAPVVATGKKNKKKRKGKARGGPAEELPLAKVETSEEPSVEISPAVDASSPVEEVASPVEEAASPAGEVISPAEEAASPIEEATSPTIEAASPVADVASSVVEAASVAGVVASHDAEASAESRAPAPAEDSASAVEDSAHAVEPVSETGASREISSVETVIAVDHVVEAAEPAPVVEPAAESFIEPAAEPVTSIAPASAPDPEEVQAQTRRVLEGEPYERSVIGSEDSMARQLIGAELLSALAGRNVERRERARAAFVEHGYFDEKTRDVREAAAPAERAAAARSLAIVGDRSAAPHLISALEDDSMEVRRAAVEALGALREPTAVEPLEALLRREKNERNRIPNRIIQHAIETCRFAAVEEARAATESARAEEAAQVEALAPQVEEAARAEEVSPPETEVAPFEEPSAETTAPETHAVVETQPVVEEIQPPEEPQSIEELLSVEEPLPVGEAPALDESPYELELEPESIGAGTPVAESNAVEPFFASPPHAFEPSVAEPQVAEESNAVAEASSVAAAETPSVEEASSIEPFEDVVSEDVLDRSLAPFVSSSEPVVSSSEPEESAKAGEWIEFDMDDIGSTESAYAAPPSPESVFELSSGETLEAERVAEPEAQTPAVESLLLETAEETPTVETRDETRGLESLFESSTTETSVEARGAEVSAEVTEWGFERGDASEAAVEPSVGTAAEAVTAPLPSIQEKGVVPFNENSTVPAVIQQRLTSRDASVRASAITELSHVDSDEAFQQICSAFDDEAKEVRSAAARALYELRTDRAESFTRALREADPDRRRNVGAAISSSGLASEAISQLTGESRDKTYEAFSLLFLMAKAGEVQPLVRAIEGHPNNEVRLAVVKLLALSGQKEILPAFRRLAVRGSLPTEVRSAVMEAIYQISSSQPTPA
jgi:HEAT repeat protein